MSGKHVRPPVSAETFDAQFDYSRRLAEHHTVPIQDKVDAYVKARREDRKMRQDEQIRTECLAFENGGTVISDEVAYAIADRWPKIRDIGAIRPGSTPSLEVYGSIKAESDKRSGDFIEDINELRELRALEAWARKQGVTA